MRSLSARLPQWSRDLLTVLLVVLGYVLMAARWNLSEHFNRLALHFESWQLDELPLTLMLLALGMCWFAFRRLRELQAALAQKTRAERRIAELLHHNSALSQKLITVQEDERRLIARELHDEFGQGCTAIRVEASLIQHQSAADGPMHAGAQRIAQAAEHLYSHVKDLLQSLRPQVLDSLGPEAAFAELCDAWERQTGIACRFVVQWADDPRCRQEAWGDALGITLYRLIQESLTNVSRHARATEVTVRLTTGSEPRPQVVLSIEDNGVGLRTPSGPQDAEAPLSGFGLLGMRERVAACQGQFELLAVPSGGLQVRVQLPLESP